MRRPSSETAPLPSLAALSISSRIRRARVASFSGGVNISLANAIWEGWIHHLPSTPSAAQARAAALYSSGSSILPNGPSIGRSP